jgi:hypothetical protein
MSQIKRVTKETPSYNKRFTRVMILLFVAMISGGLFLQLIGGKPVQQMGWSLSSQQQMKLPATGVQVGVTQHLLSDHWQSIEISYRLNNRQNSLSEGLTGALALEYHFIISQNNGETIKTHMWKKQLSIKAIAQDRDHSGMIRICIIGDPIRAQKTALQRHSLENLLSELHFLCKKDFKMVWPRSPVVLK